MRRRERRGFWFGLAVVILKPLLTLFTRRDWRGAEHIPAEGPCIIAVNHISHIDPLTFAHFVHDHGRIPRFLVKQELFRVPFVGRLLAGAGQLPVQRRSRDAIQAVQAGVDALASGKVVAIYPEGTITRDPQLWPMLAKTGVARLALATGAPVIPVAQWGAHEVLWPYTKRPALVPPRTVRYLAGPPVNLSAYDGRPLTAEVLRAATDDIMARIRGQLGDLRGQAPPAAVHDPRGTDMAPPPPPTAAVGVTRAPPYWAPARGAPRSPWCSPTPARAVTPVGPPLRAGRADRGPPREPRLPAGHPPARPAVRPPRDVAGRWTGPSSSSSRSRHRRCARTSSPGHRCCRREAVLVSLMKGVELGTSKRMSEVIREVADVPAERVAVVSGPNLAKEIVRQPAHGDRGRVQRRCTAERVQTACHAPLLPAVHEHRRGRLRARRRGQERHRAGRRHGRGHGLRRQHPGVPDHPRPGRDRPARRGDGRRPADVLRARRSR